MKHLLTLVGITHAPQARYIVPHLIDGQSMLLVREPANPHDKNAIAVYVRVGFVKASEAASLAPKLDVLGYETYDAKMVRNEGHYAEMEVEEPINPFTEDPSDMNPPGNALP